MTTPLHALYHHAWKERDTEYWMLDDDLALDYRTTMNHAEKQEKYVRERLEGHDKAEFEKLIDNMRWMYELEAEMMFNRGVAVGLRLGGLSL